MPKPANSSRPVAGSRILQDTFEKLSDQADSVPEGVKKVFTPPPVEENINPPELTPQQIAQKRAAENHRAQFHRQQVKRFDEEYQQLQETQKLKEKQNQQEANQKEEQAIIQLQEAEARAAVLQPPAKPKQGRGTAFMSRQTKQRRGTGELSKMPSN